MYASAPPLLLEALKVWSQVVDNQGVNMRQHLLQNRISYLVGFLADEQV